MGWGGVVGNVEGFSSDLLYLADWFFVWYLNSIKSAQEIYIQSFMHMSS